MSVKNSTAVTFVLYQTENICLVMILWLWHQPGVHLSGKVWSMGSMGSKIVELCHTHGLSTHNNGCYTRIQNGTISAPYLTLSRGLLSNYSWHVDQLIKLNSDHCPIVFVIPKPSGANKTRWYLRNTDWDLWKTEFDSCFTPFCVENTNQPFATICKKFSDTLIKCAQTNIPTKTICDHSKSLWTLI